MVEWSVMARGFKDGTEIIETSTGTSPHLLLLKRHKLLFKNAASVLGVFHPP